MITGKCPKCGAYFSNDSEAEFWYQTKNSEQTKVRIKCDACGKVSNHVLEIGKVPEITKYD
jgi:endogenous inhibitor of DNA gyrase (YacG/DUF329 family)